MVTVHFMIQISLEKMAALMAENGVDIAEHPDLAAQVMAVNQQLAAMPGFDEATFRDMVSTLLSNINDAPKEVPLHEPTQEQP